MHWWSSWRGCRACIEMLAEPLSLRLPCGWITWWPHTLPVGAGCWSAASMTVGGCRALGSENSYIVYVDGCPAMGLGLAARRFDGDARA